MKTHRASHKLHYNGYPAFDDVQQLVADGFTDILNLDLPYMGLDDYRDLRIDIHHCLLHDMGALALDRAIWVLDLVSNIMRKDNSKLYVHCNAGVSRSPTVVYLYMTIHEPQTALPEFVEFDSCLIDDRLIDQIREHYRCMDGQGN